MRTMRIFVLLTLIASLGAVTPLGGCDARNSNGSESGEAQSRDDVTTAEDVAEEVAEATGAAKAFAQDQVQKYRAAMADRLDHAAERIDSLETRAAELGEDAQAKFQDTVDDLKARRDALQRDLDEVQASSQNAWNDLKKGLDQSWTELDEAIESAMDRFDSKGAEKEQPDTTKSSG